MGLQGSRDQDQDASAESTGEEGVAHAGCEFGPQGVLLPVLRVERRDRVALLVEFAHEVGSEEFVFALIR